jgi:LuxR family maltose regulon positive regulatory protein
LESRLETAAKLTVVAAPAGWGKTSLLSRWAAGASADRAVAWVSLDESDDEPVRFFSYVLTALRQVSDDIGPAALDALASGDGPMAQALPLLLNELAAASARHVLVLDDYHVITNADVHDGMEFLLSYLPSTLRIVLAGRADPPFALARMRVRGELAELRAQDLRFSGDESVALLSAVAATEVDAAAASAVTDRAEGWAAGLQLAGLALRQAVIAPVRGDDRHLFDYFTAEVFPALAAAQRDLLVRAAPLELLSGSLCDAALDVKGSAAVLAELERADLFVVALDRQRDWYRCHRLLREALGWSRGSEPDETTRDVLRRAAGWFADHDRIDDAVRHLQDAGDHAEAADRLVKGQLWFLDRGWAATYLALGERLPEAAVPPQLALFLAYAAGAGENRERARHWLDVCDRQIDADTVIEGWRSARAAEFSLRGLLATDPSRCRDGGRPGVRPRGPVLRRDGHTGKDLADARPGSLVERGRSAGGRPAVPFPAGPGVAARRRCRRGGGRRGRRRARVGRCRGRPRHLHDPPDRRASPLSARRPRLGARPVGARPAPGRNGGPCRRHGPRPGLPGRHRTRGRKPG